MNFNLKIRDFLFNAQAQAAIESWRENSHAYGYNWPVVYIIHNDKTHEAYIGETLNAGKRVAQHWQNEDRQRLKIIHILTDETFNKSVILDLEAFLIKYVSADGKYKLQNSNGGLSDFNYYDREKYEKNFLSIWDRLKELGLVKSSIADIENSDLFKYSPYKALTEDQQSVLNRILYSINGYLQFGIEQSILVEGGAGTGKTVLAVFLIKLLSDLGHNIIDNTEFSETIDTALINGINAHSQKLKIGFVIPQQSLRETIKKVFKTIHGLSDKMIISPQEIVKCEPFDILIVDEAHRLHRRNALSQFRFHDNNNKALGLPKDSTELDWVLARSKAQVLFYDKEQSVRPSDIKDSVFTNTLNGHSVTRLRLSSQLRCLGGDDYIQYVKAVLNSTATTVHGAFKGYTTKLFNNVDEMIQQINCLNTKYGLSCTVAGYGWKWKTKKMPPTTSVRDIEIGHGYIWNRTNVDWINSSRLPHEIGCIHTVQGYDLNYVGVIFGPEIVYNKSNNRVEVIKKNYYDNLGKSVGKDSTALREYIINIYATLMTRGIHGTYIYVCDPDLREYLRKYFPTEA